MYNFPKSGFGRFEMRTWIFLISTSIHGFSQNSPVQARGRSPGQSLSWFYIPFWDLAGWEDIGNNVLPKRQICKCSKYNGTE